MIKYTNVHCGDTPPQEVEINVDTVYKRYNIHTYIDNDGNQGYEYDEDQMTLLEYFKEIIPADEKALGELSILFATYQMQINKTLGELSMLIQGVNSNV